MSDSQNQHGLSRHIPAPIAREIRQRCGFGCVVCGEALVQYDHHNPEYADATEHHADGIALLCPTHHIAKGNGMLSMTAYRKAIDDPKAVRDGGAETAWELSEFAPQLVLGNITYQGGTSILAIDDIVVLGFSEPEQDGGPPQLDLTFFDRDGDQIFKVEKNIITANSGSFDVEQTGRTFKIRSGLHKLDLEIRFYPPTRIVIERMRWRKGPWGLVVTNEETKLLNNGGDVLSVTGGRTLVTGPQLWNCKSDGSLSSENITMEGLGPRSLPYDSLARDVSGGGIIFPFPVWLLINEDSPKPPLEFTMANIEGTPVLPIFTQPELATQGGVPEGFHPRKVEHQALVKLLREAAPHHGLSLVAIDPIVGSGTEESAVAFTIDSVVDSLTSTNDEDVAKLLNPEG